jgi:hypothetical protein
MQNDAHFCCRGSNYGGLLGSARGGAGVDDVCGVAVALWITWEQLMQSPVALTNYIEQAKRTPRILIYNNRARRYRNV